MSDGAPRVSVIVPTWNGCDLLRAALRSLRAQSYRDFETVVVDNGSSDGTDAMLRSEFPEVRLVAFPENRGFAVAVNAGLRAARGRYLMLLNNDAEAEPAWLEKLVAVLDERAEVGSVASKMLSAREEGVVDSAGAAMGLFAYDIGRGERDGPRFGVAREILCPCGGAAAYRREVFDAVGCFDEAFFAWFEDVELGIRAQLAGFRCWYAPEARVRHHAHASAGQLSIPKTVFTVRNALLLFVQTMPLRRLLPCAPLLFVWPFLDPIFSGRPLRATARGWLAFWRLFPHALRARRRNYAGRRVAVSRLTALLESPAPDFGRAVRLLAARLRGASAPGAA
ncbi:MAG TPA: glycosyltransferase family 2 protein [Gemmatimonadales bacterium]|nr:glycosyltransferase family 2 protein [Gemmatimonadales bacterium]